MKTDQVRPWYARIESFLSWKFSLRPSATPGGSAFDVGYKFFFTLACLCDMATQAALEGVRAAFPGYDARTDNLSLIGAGRLLIQGEAEPSSAFAVRLQNWLTTAKDMGGDVGLAKQIHTYLGNSPRVRIWNRKGRCTTVDTDGTVTQVDLPGGLNWDSVSNPERAEFWWDHWIVIYPDENAHAVNINASPRTGVIGQADPLRQQGIGHLCSRTQRDVLLGIIRVWKGQHVSVRLIVWTNDATLFDPGNPGAAGNPDGKWGRPSFFGTCPSGTVGSGIGQWPSRNRNCRYWVPRS